MVGTGIDTRRIRKLNDKVEAAGPVVYFMSRDSRVADNWALVFARQKALDMREPLIVAHTLAADWPSMGRRQYEFLLGGLKQISAKLEKLNISFMVVENESEMAALLSSSQAGAIVVDFNPLRESRAWKRKLADRAGCPVYEVDAHNSIPVPVVSPKQEYAAYTIRPKINKLLPEFLTSFPAIDTHPYTMEAKIDDVDWEKLFRAGAGRTGHAVDTFESGEDSAITIMEAFLTRRLERYHTARNDANAGAVSNLSPYLHFGFISAQRVAIEAQRFDSNFTSRESFLEELIVRRELADNYCFYNDAYDSFAGFPAWAQKSLDEHRSDPRVYIYTREEFEAAETHDTLWNAAQRELIGRGKMHGYLRMYWAKKILEWSVSPEDAQETALYLNDTYSLDGCDPNGFTGVAWSVGGVHDRPWFERDIFGKVRYMAVSGCRKKFDINEYIAAHNQIRLDISS